ncbi:DUF2746 domain-containing protein [Mycobacteroides chelonae]|uniref:DUF2746 domain-containing protein n=1 Tax=Mycobacteroides chelonae TaxID=1774 RepID=UPI000991F9D7|nr:DUF2746 domain-containing protein [Mycobacteroides chelonae]
MNITPFNPDDWMDVLVLFGLSAFSLLAAVLPVWLNLRKQNRHLRTIKHEVKNDHGDDTNLRDDIDKIARAVETGFREIKTEFCEVNGRLMALHTDLQQERQDRMDGDQLRLIRGHR